MILPTIHRNGTSGEDLLEQTCTAADAVKVAIRALENAGPNGRDYYPQGPDALQRAATEHRERIAKLAEVVAELEEMAERIVDAIDEQDGRSRAGTTT